MRTTVEIPDDKVAKLRALAVRRGMRGYSGLIQEAIDRYLDGGDKGGGSLEGLLEATGSWSEEEAAELEKRLAEFWGAWTERS